MCPPLLTSAAMAGSEDAGEAGIEDVLDLNLDDIDDDVHGQVCRIL